MHHSGEIAPRDREVMTGIVSRALRSMERLRNDALQTRDPGVWGWRDWVPALRCTAEEALHRVRDTMRRGGA